MCYDVHFDRRNSQRSRYMQLSDIAKLLPFYGRSRGTEHPGMVMFNRGGEPWFYDLMVDKTKNAHFLLLGETGTGKSNLLNFLIMQDLALYNSRFFIIDAGGSFDLLGDYCKSFGLTVNKIKIDPKHPVSLNPFAYGLRVIDQIESLNTETHEEFLSIECDKLLKEQSDNVKNQELDEEPRDILGDMVLAALIMITGGEKKEEDTIRRSDRMLIIDAIINAAYFVRDNNREQMIASDIIDAFERITLKLNPDRDAEKIRRAREMADSMRYFTNDPVSAKFFNSYGTPWELADVTIVDFGLFANEGYEAQRSIAFAGCMTKILALAEINQKSNRSIKVVLDENHIFTSIPLLADIETRVAKMGRKLGLWLWLATQNLRDFADNARRMLAQIEHWICLSLPLDEIDQIERFKQITIEMRNLFLSARKEKGKYTEGVILGMIKALFRNVPPSLYLAMAATDQDEKNHRAQIMQKFQCSEIEAVKIIARDMMKLKQETKEDD
jgi:conjugative transfer ATPase